MGHYNRDIVTERSIGVVVHGVERARARSSQDQGRAADARQGHLSLCPAARAPYPTLARAPLVRANICDRLSSTTDMPRSVRRAGLEVISSDFSRMKDERFLSVISTIHIQLVV
ncbi:unnamed protein product [Euphydryas editha]|uniref:Uncharacterized protein n=1 Tax=Euphydryas editha TaxID=104508 RepID=A0AAU9TJX5_EUPED|nr:unnamed protein product [Euphydryas editha]